MEVVIYGAGALGRLAKNILWRNGSLEVIGFIDDDPLMNEFDVEGLKVIGGGKDLPGLKRFGVEGICVAVHDGDARLWIAKLAQSIGLELISAIHEKASISPEASIGRSCIIDRDVTVEDGAKVGDCCFIAKGSRIKMNAEVRPGTSVSPGSTVECEENDEVLV